VRRWKIPQNIASRERINESVRFAIVRADVLRRTGRVGRVSSGVSPLQRQGRSILAAYGGTGVAQGIRNYCGRLSVGKKQNRSKSDPRGLPISLYSLGNRFSRRNSLLQVSMSYFPGALIASDEAP